MTTPKDTPMATPKLFKRYLEKELGRKVDLGIESALKPEARKFIEKEIVYV